MSASSNNNSNSSNSSSKNNNNNSDFVKSTAILTEHLGYAPIALIDDVINAVNEILYKCTSAMETFLQQRHAAQHSVANGGSNSGDDDRAAAELEEIELGTAKLETFLESIVDKSFDRFELYVLRNILLVPPELVAGGWIRLAHQRGVDFTQGGPSNNNNSNQSQSNNGTSSSNRGVTNDTIADLYTQLSVQARANKILRAHKRRIERLVATLEHYSTAFILPPTQFSGAAGADGDNSVGGMPEDVRAKFRAISPITESLNFLATQVRVISEKTHELELVMQQYSLGNNNNGVSSAITNQVERDLFVDALTQRAVEMAGFGRHAYASSSRPDDAAREPAATTEHEIRPLPTPLITEAQDLADLINE
ncbi:hypothetical protein D0Z00_000186 [Geotrichum galactomycetum]|uniref:Uncharacterized protein n=1 Tax=Geotrichum galactomycetum TaxID=27317 RepID=A0ACB6VAK9_9ASCO|nr:hypothetical protein D0Z00_000186 [Geotrichum candidum]